MNANRKSYASPVGDREVMTGQVVGQVIESKHQQYQVGDFVGAKLDGKPMVQLKVMMPAKSIHLLLQFLLHWEF